MSITKREIVKLIEEKYDFKTKKTLGQNFLISDYVIDSIISAQEIDLETLVIEIGPGLGVITNELCKKAKKVIAIELDKNLIPILNETLADFNNYEILNQDILKTDLNEVIRESFKDDKTLKKVRIIGNLPYYITTPIIMKIFEEDVKCDSITVMMQKEVADRIKASSNNKDYGALSIAVQYYSEIEKVCDANKECFMPRPKVDSTVLKLILKDSNIDIKDKKTFFKTVKAGFAQRRKTLLNSLQTLNIGKEKVKVALDKAGIDPNRRAETLKIEEFAKLSDCIYDVMD